MNDYYRVRIDVAECTEDITDLAAAYLADAGFESFEPDSTGLTAYIKREAGDGVKIAEESLSDFPMESDFKITGEVIEGEDWNEEWEKHYEMVWSEMTGSPSAPDNVLVINYSVKDVPVTEFERRLR